MMKVEVIFFCGLKKVLSWLLSNLNPVWSGTGGGGGGGGGERLGKILGGTKCPCNIIMISIMKCLHPLPRQCK